MRVSRKRGVVWGGVLPTGGVANEPRAKKSLLFPRLYPFRVEPEGLSLVMAGVGNPPPPPSRPCKVSLSRKVRMLRARLGKLKVSVDTPRGPLQQMGCTRFGGVAASGQQRRFGKPKTELGGSGLLVRVSRKRGVVWGGVLPTVGVANEPRDKKSLLSPRFYPFRVELKAYSFHG